MKKLTRKTVKKQTLAEQVAARIEAAIVGGAWTGGDALPTEPEIAEQFGVSRTVVRDATRMLAARGLVEARHGKGVFVTDSPVAGFADALLLALRRLDATNWDVVQFEQILYPQVVALAAENATAADIEKIEAAAAGYLAFHRSLPEDAMDNVEDHVLQSFLAAWKNLIQAIFDATHNVLIALLAEPLLRLRNVNRWANLPDTHANLETELVQSIVALIAAGDPDKARREATRLLALPNEAISAMQQTPVGEITQITLESKPPQ